jgi:predicted small metal-binding protein
MFEYRCKHLVEDCDQVLQGESSESVEELALAHLLEAHKGHAVHDSLDSGLIPAAIFQIHA